MAGAAVLSALGAARSGAGLIKVATVKSQQAVVAKRAPLEATNFGFPEDTSGRIGSSALPLINKLINDWRPDVIAIGPGLGVSATSIKLVKNLLRQPGLRVVLDADGLNALAKQKSFRISAELLMTPHPGELGRLLRTSPGSVELSREASCKKAAIKFRGVCLLKGAGTLVTDGKNVWNNTTGNPAMASGGMGDVLTGLIAALWAQDLKNGLRAAALGAFVHGLAGDLARRDFPERTLLASDLARYLPQAFKKLKSSSRRKPGSKS